MRRIVPFVLAVVLANPGCRCQRLSAAKPIRLAPDASDAAKACGVAREPARGVAHETADGRTFYVWTPSSYDGTRPTALLFAVHGLGSDGLGFQSWFKMEEHVDDSAIVVYPDAKDGTWDVGGESDLAFFDAMIDGMSTAYCVDRAHVFALGFSYGGKMVHHLGCKRTSRFKAISVGDGSWNDTSPTCGRLPVLVTHRTRDQDELLDWGKDAALRWSKVNGCSPETEPVDPAHHCVQWRACAPGASVTFCEDTWFSEKWPESWNHTIREDYLRLTWRWFAGLP